MQLLIDSIHEFYNNVENLAAFEKWKERKRNDDDTATQSKTQKNDESQKVGA